MDTPHSLQIPPPQPMAPRVVQAFAKIDAISRLALLCVFVGWFFMNTLTVSLGSLQHGVRFFDMAAVIADPARLFFRVDASFQRVLFGLICLACLAAPLSAHIVKKRVAWIAYLTPLLLMLVCGVLLRSRASNEFLTSPTDARWADGGLLRFANDLAREGGLISTHISVGAGGYLALIGSVMLAVTAVHRLRARS